MLPVRGGARVCPGAVALTSHRPRLRPRAAATAEPGGWLSAAAHFPFPTLAAEPDHGRANSADGRIAPAPCGDGRLGPRLGPVGAVRRGPAAQLAVRAATRSAAPSRRPSYALAPEPSRAAARRAVRTGAGRPPPPPPPRPCRFS